MMPVDAFVKYLDKNNFLAAKEYLTDGVVYRFRGQKIVGVEQVISCYQDSYESVQGQIDEIILESEIIDFGNNRFRTNYTDILYKNGNKHVHRCYQELLCEDGKIVEISHFDIDGEVDALESFFKANGIVRKTK